MANTTHDTEFRFINAEELDKHAATMRRMREDAEFLSKSGFNFKGYGGAQADSFGASSPHGSGESDLDKRYKYEHMKYMREDLKLMNFAKSAGGAASGIGRGVYGFSQGGGLGSIFSGIQTGLNQAVKAGGFLAPFMTGMTLARGARGVARGAASAEAAEGGSVVEGVAASGVLAGLFKILPIPVKLTAVAGAAGGLAYLSEQAAAGLVGRNRRAQGFGADLGPLTSFDNTMNRYVNPDSVMAAMRSAKYDITSPAYQAMRIAGIDPKGWTSTTDMGEAALMKVQEQLKGFGKQDPQTMLTMAHAHQLQNLGLSDDDLMRLYQAPEGDVRDLVKQAQAHGESLGIDPKTIKDNQDFMTGLGLATAEAKRLAEVLNTGLLPGFKDIIDELGAFSQKENLKSTLTIRWRGWRCSRISGK
jgi:hypothetical protein